MSNIIELFGETTANKVRDWKSVVDRQWCPYLDRKCIKVRKSQPDVSIGSCSVLYGKAKRPIVICPFRLLERRQVFTDCLHLLTVHEPGNELHIVSEVSIPGGSVDYFLASVRGGKVKDFVGVELQTLDTTGTVWPARQRYLQDVGVNVVREETAEYKTYGMNWKMTAKTILIQLHHKVQTFEALNKHLVLVIQDFLLEYLRREFKFSHLTDARNGDPVHLHAYSMSPQELVYRLSLVSRLSTDSEGIAVCLGLQAETRVELARIIDQIESKLSKDTLFSLG
ncbi:MAG TPA: NotI family restriction endonuclease [Candidatus Hydrogenedentes bacterium]|nr:NotI family restriction endonuclease [Candidatus Hydrogenedentota bacterium]